MEGAVKSGISCLERLSKVSRRLGWDLYPVHETVTPGKCFATLAITDVVIFDDDHVKSC